MAFHPSDPGWADPDLEQNDDQNADAEPDVEMVETSRDWLLMHDRDNEDAWVAMNSVDALDVEDAPSDEDVVVEGESDDAWIACDADAAMDCADVPDVSDDALVVTGESSDAWIVMERDD